MSINKNFVVKNGLEVSTDLILANDVTNKVGIATTNPQYTLHVNGGIGATTLFVSGISTLSSLVLPGTVSAGGSTGSSGQYLKSTGTGVAWENFPVARASTTVIATTGQTTINYAYTIGLVDVFINGVKLTPSEFTATDGVSIVLATPCFGGEVIDIHAYGASGVGAGVSGIAGLTIQEEGSTTGNPANVTSINFVGASVTAVGSGAGVTVYISGTGGGGGPGDSYWIQTTSGIHTLGNVGVGTTNPRFALEVGAVGASGTSLYVNGDARITGILTVGSSSITLDGSNNTINVGSGITINGDTGRIDASDFYASGLQVGVITATTIVYEGGVTLTQDWIKTDAGIHTLGKVGIGITNPTSPLTVSGNTSLQNLTVSGVSTFNGVISTPQLIGDVSASDIYVETLTISGVSTVNQIKFPSSTNSVDNVLYFGNGDNLNIHYNSGSGEAIIQTSGAPLSLRVNGGENALLAYENGQVELYYNNSKKFETSENGVTVTGTTFTNQLSVSGDSTLTSNVSVGGTINLSGGLKLTTNNPTIVGTSGTVGEIKRIGGAPFFYDGTAWREFVLSSGTPVSVPADSEWDNVILRTTFDTDFTDAKFGVSPVYIGAGSSIVGAAVTIGTGAFRNDGTIGAGISYAYRSDYDFTGSWTFETWIYFDNGVSNNSVVSIFALKNDADTSGECALFLQTDGFANKYFYWGNENGATQVVFALAGSSFDSSFLRKWVHIALVRESDNGSLHFYVNGVESNSTYLNTVIDNDILDISGTGLVIGGTSNAITINGVVINNGYTVDAIYDDLRISAGVGTAGQRYTSVGIVTTTTFTPSTSALPTTGTLSSYIQPPGDKYGEIGLGTSPTWRGTSGVTVSQQSSGNYRVSFASSYTNYNDYFVLTQPMDQGFASYVGVARSTTYVDFAISKESDDAAVDTGSLSVQIKNHV